MIFKLKKANAPSRFAIFTSPPNWEALAMRISELFNIPLEDILVVFIKNKEPVALADDEELQHFYKSLDQTDEEIKFVVQDQEDLDTITTITSTWSAGSNPNDGKLSLGCLDLDSPNPLLVEVEKHETVSKLKGVIKEEIQYELPHHTLNLWKVSPPIPSSELNLRLWHGRSPKDIKGCILLNPFDKLSDHFSSPPRKHLHIIVEHPPTETPPVKRRTLEDVVGSIETGPHAKRRRIVSSPPSPGNAARRDATVRALFQRLEQYKFIQVRGTPGSGKTTLAQLLARHICEEDETRRIIWLSGWPEKEVRESGGHRQYLRENGWEEGVKTVFIFDEVQLSYWDDKLWRDFFRDIDRYEDLRAIALASYGSPTSRIHIGGRPVQLSDAQRVTLVAIDPKDGIPPVGLLFTREEVDDFISILIRKPENYFDLSFFDALFNLTRGHVGAIKDFVRIIMADESYRRLKNHPNRLYSWDTFLRCVRPYDLLHKLKDSCVFGRGLPEHDDFQDPVIAKIFSAVLCNGHVTNKSFTDERDKLQHCFHNGYLHSDRFGKEDGVAYFFPSSLHRWFVEWKLWDTLPALVPFETGHILNFVINVISNFSPRQLGTERRIASGGIQRPPEAQYQDEFYRSAHIFSKGSIVTFPEYDGTAASGRVDFYIQAKEWGIELLRDGDKLAQHSGRFSKNGSYATALACSDYIILDFRNTHPRVPHPHLQKLYHVVVSDDFLDVSVLNNKLDLVDGGKIRLLASS